MALVSREEGKEGEGGLPSPWGSGTRDAISASPWHPMAQENGVPHSLHHMHPHSFLLMAPFPSQALPAYSKDSQTYGEVLPYSLLLGHVWVKGAVPNNGGPPGSTGQDFRPGPGRGREGETGSCIHLLGEWSLPPFPLPPSPGPSGPPRPCP